MSIQSYLQETKSELKHVKWLSPTETWHYAALVIGISLLVALFLALFDFIFLNLLSFILVG